MPSNTELLEQIIKHNEKSSQKHLEILQRFEEYKREQNDINKKILGYLHNDNDTNQKGLVEKVDKLTEKVSNLDKRLIKLSAVYSTGATGLVLFMKWLMGKIII